VSANHGSNDDTQCGPCNVNVSAARVTFLVTPGCESQPWPPVWGEDKNHMFAYTYDEYKQSLTVGAAVQVESS
jgi:hypothetical protein